MKTKKTFLDLEFESMSFKWNTNMILLGAGGKDPRIEAVMVDSSATQDLIELPRMHSVYSIDIDFDNNSIAVGTKGGLIYVIAENRIQEPIAHGVPILSVCWVKKSLLAVSDIAGRCLLWSTDKESLPQPLEVVEGVICSLLNLIDGTLSGLSSIGELLFWRPPGNRLIRTITVPAPPRIKALIKIVYWSFADALVYPSRGGRLTIYDIEKDNIINIPAHKGTFYAMCSWGKNLITIGLKDRFLKTWIAGCDRPEKEFQVQEGAISVGVEEGPQPKLILVTAQGTAGIYTLEEHRLRNLHQLKGKDYRVIATPPPEKVNVFYAQKRFEEVQQIITEIRDNNGRVSDDIINGHHSRLIDLGYENVSLMLRAEKAELEKNIIESLKNRFSLIGILPVDDQRACISMERYAALLEKVWHIREADAVCKQILSIDTNYPFVMQTNNLSRIAKLIESGSWIIEPDISTISIDSIIESATIIGKRFIGRYVIKRLNPEPCGRVILNPEIIIEKYRQILNDSGEKTLPPATTERAWWFSNQGNYEADLITFGNGQTNNVKGLQFTAQIFSNELGTVVVPVVLFDWRINKNSHSIEKGNKKALEVLTNIRNKAITNPYLAEIHKALKHTLRRLITKNM
jgi:hypothetical protein